MTNLFEEIGAWSAEAMPHGEADTFKLKAAHELAEFLMDGGPEEAADVIICLAGWAHRRGIDLEVAIRAKHNINLRRRWTRLSDGTYRHDDELELSAGELIAEHTGDPSWA